MTVPDTDDSPRDPGLARERTELAWNRSGLAVVVCIAVVLRHLWPLHGTSEVVALAVVAGVAMVWAAVLFVLRDSRRDPGDAAPVGHRTFGLVTLGTVVLAVGAVTLTLLTPA